MDKRKNAPRIKIGDESAILSASRTMAGLVSRLVCTLTVFPRLVHLAQCDSDQEWQGLLLTPRFEDLK